jgi:hypothetical protein
VIIVFLFLRLFGSKLVLSESWQLRRVLAAHEDRYRERVAFEHPPFDLLLGCSSEAVEVPRQIRHKRVGLVPNSIFHDVPHPRSSSLPSSQPTAFRSIRSSDVLRRFLPKLAVALVPSYSSFLLLSVNLGGDHFSEDTLEGGAPGTALASALGTAQIRKNLRKVPRQSGAVSRTRARRYAYFIPRSPCPRVGERPPKGPRMAFLAPIGVCRSYLGRIFYGLTLNCQLLAWLPAVIGSWSSRLPDWSLAPPEIVAT